MASKEDHAIARLTHALLFEDASKGSLNLAEVARVARVSRSFLYQNERARELVERARTREEELQDYRSATEVASWKQRAHNAEMRVRELGGEVATLRTQLVAQMSHAKEPNWNAHPDALGRSQRELVAAQQESKELADQLEASRDNVRFLNGRLEAMEAAELGRSNLFGSGQREGGSSALE